MNDKSSLLVLIAGILIGYCLMNSAIEKQIQKEVFTHCLIYYNDTPYKEASNLCASITGIKE
jgi:hypothetical protein